MESLPLAEPQGTEAKGTEAQGTEAQGTEAQGTEAQAAAPEAAAHEPPAVAVADAAERADADERASTLVSSNPLVRLLYFVSGCLTFALAMVGIFVRGIPTTPFLLLTAFAFARSSPRLHRWLLDHRRFGPMLRDLQAGRGLTLRFKAATVVFSWSFMLATAIWLIDSWYLRAFLAFAALIQLYVFIRVIPTRPPAGAHGGDPEAPLPRLR